MEGSINHNALVQLYSPLVTSQRYMLDMKQDPYQVIQLEDGTLYVFEMVITIKYVIFPCISVCFYCLNIYFLYS